MCAAKGGSLARTGSKAKNAEKRVVFPYGKRDAFVPFGILYRHVSGCPPNGRSGRPLRCDPFDRRHWRLCADGNHYLYCGDRFDGHLYQTAKQIKNKQKTGGFPHEKKTARTGSKRLALRMHDVCGTAA